MRAELRLMTLVEEPLLPYPRDMETDDRALLRRCIDGDRRAWDLLVDRVSRYVYYLIQLTARRYAAELTADEMGDLHNDLFLALMEDDCRRLRAFQGKNGCSVRSWIRIITIRKTLDALRKRRPHLSLDVGRDDGERSIELVDHGPDPLAALLAKSRTQRRARLAELTDGLSESDRLLLEMLYVEKMSATAIAALLRIKKGAVYTRKTRLIQRLRQAAEALGLVEAQS